MATAARRSTKSETGKRASLPGLSLSGVVGWLRARVGKKDRLHVVVLFACVLGLESADLGTIGAVAPQLEHAFGINHAQLGLLASGSLLVSALTALPFGVLADRASRVRMLWMSVTLWGLGMIVVGASPSFGFMIGSRLVLGLMMAAAGPALASLIGDYFPPQMRGRIYGLIGAGELIGAAFGFMVSGGLAAAITWRFAFWILALPAFALAWALWRFLREPTGAREDEELTQIPLPRAVRYVLGIRTNVTLIAAAAVGYFFFAGLRTFAVEFLRRHFGLSQAEATALIPLFGLGALAGVLASGRIADRLLARGHVNARIDVPVVCFVAATLLLLPGFLIGSLALAMVFFVIAGAALSGANPPLDSARLDIVPSALWGRAESVRTVLRELAQAGAPLLFGVTADAFGGRHGGGVQSAFLIMLVPLAVSGGIVWLGRRSYRADVRSARRDAIASKGT